MDDKTECSSFSSVDSNSTYPRDSYLPSKSTMFSSPIEIEHCKIDDYTIEPYGIYFNMLKVKNTFYEKDTPLGKISVEICKTRQCYEDYGCVIELQNSSIKNINELMNKTIVSYEKYSHRYKAEEYDCKSKYGFKLNLYGDDGYILIYSYNKHNKYYCHECRRTILGKKEKSEI